MAVLSVGMSPQIFTTTQNHKHDAWEIVLNIEGTGYTQIGEKRYFYEPGTIICQPPNVFHNKSSEEGFRDIYIQLSAFSLSGAGDRADKNNVLLLHDDTEKSFETLLFLAHRVFHKKENNHKLLVEALFESMNQLMISWFRQMPEESDIEQLKNRLVHSFTDPELSVRELLTEGPYCHDHLRRGFKQATGQTPVEYLTDLRLNYAKKLLQENHILNYTIAEIGAMAGYYDSRYFARVFKKKMGATPYEYLLRQENGAENEETSGAELLS